MRCKTWLAVIGCVLLNLSGFAGDVSAQKADKAEGKAEEKKPPIYWGEPERGLRVGIACQAVRPRANSQPLFMVAFWNVGKVSIRLPGPLGFSQRSQRDGWITYSRPLGMSMIRRVEGRGAATINLGGPPAKAGQGVFVLKPGEKREFADITLANETLSTKEKEVRPSRRKFILMPNSSYRISFGFESNVDSMGGRPVWRGRAYTGEVDIAVREPSIENPGLEADFVPLKSKQVKGRRKPKEPSVPKYFLGEPVYVEFVVTHKGKKPIGMRVGSRRSSMGRHEGFEFTASDTSGQPATDLLDELPYRGGIGAGPAAEEMPILKPGQTYQRKLLINKWVRFVAPGTYKVHCWRVIRIAENEEQLKTWPTEALPTVEFEEEITIEVVENKDALAKYIRRLCGLLGKPETAARANEEMKTLALSRNPQLLAMLDRMVRKPNPFQNSAITWLAYFGAEHAVPASLQALRTDDVAVRTNAINILAHYEQEDIARLVGVALRSRAAVERRNAVNLCRAHKYEERLKQLISMANDPDKWVRSNLGLALGEYGDVKAVPALKKLLYVDKEREVKVSAAAGLGKLGRNDGVPILIDMLQENSGWRFRRRVAQTLAGITEQNFGVNYKKWHDWWEEEGKNVLHEVGADEKRQER